MRRFAAARLREVIGFVEGLFRFVGWLVRGLIWLVLWAIRFARRTIRIALVGLVIFLVLLILVPLRILLSVYLLLRTILLYVLPPWRWLAALRWLAHSKVRYFYIGGTYDPGARDLPRTALQKHGDFFDGNRDGVITFRESRRALRSIGFGHRKSLAFAPLINLFFGWQTWQTFVPTLTLNANALHLMTHGSATNIFAYSGRLDGELMSRFINDYSRDEQISTPALQRLMDDKKVPGWRPLTGRIFAQTELPVLAQRVAAILHNPEDQALTEGQAHTDEPAFTDQQFKDFYEGSLLDELKDNL